MVQLRWFLLREIGFSAQTTAPQTVMCCGSSTTRDKNRDFSLDQPPHQISNTGALALSRIGEGKIAGLSENEELAGKVNPSTMLLVINYICNYALL
uniref:Uncharacterized protein n=1 Tax=Picea glauca TaxID=3330 RepID=A0A101LWJ9_PICGL|nr:hypothetical protein ABT39_MTgene1339 [Picea glauca]